MTTATQASTTEQPALIETAKQAQAARKAAEAEAQRIEAAALQHREKAAEARAEAQAELATLTDARDALAASVALGEAKAEKLAAMDKRIAALQADPTAANATSTEAGINRRLVDARAALAAATEAEGKAIHAVLLERQKQAAQQYRKNADAIRALLVEMHALGSLILEVEPRAGMEKRDTLPPFYDLEKLYLKRTMFCDDRKTCSYENILEARPIYDASEAEELRFVAELAEQGLEL